MTSSPPTRAEIDLTAGFLLLGQPVAIRSSSVVALGAFRRLYRRLPALQDPSAAHVVEVVKHRDDGSNLWEAIGADLPRNRPVGLGEALQRAEADLCIHALQQYSTLVGLHAATIAFQDGFALITGDSGAGKTTLTLALAARGYPVDGDDMAMLDPDSGLVTGLPRCFHLDDASIELLGAHGMDVHSIEACEGFLTPADVGDGGMQARPVKAVFFLERDRLPQPVVSPVSLADAIARLHDQWGPRYVSSAQLFGLLAAMLENAQCFELRRGPLGLTADLVVRTMEGLESR